MADRPPINFEIIEHLGVISTSTKGWQTEVNLIRWNNNPAKLDLRSWPPNHEKPGKGITLTDEEAQKLIEILQASV